MVKSKTRKKTPLVKWLWRIYGCKCFYCGIETHRDVPTKINPKDRMLVANADHFLPVRYGGDNSYDNVVLSCRRCNFAKSDTHPLILLLVECGVKS